MADVSSLGRIQDELEIRNLIARLAHLADDGELDEYLDQFTEDAAWGGGRHAIRRGRDEIREGVRARRKLGHMGPGTGSLHVVTTTCIEIQGDRETGRSVYHYYREVASAAPTLCSLGVYADVFRKTAAGWRLAERVLKGSDEEPPAPSG
jgi:3-phenylpropionate/cinnamic acid dioxygenase small subunit